MLNDLICIDINCIEQSAMALSHATYRSHILSLRSHVMDVIFRVKEMKGRGEELKRAVHHAYRERDNLMTQTYILEQVES